MMIGALENIEATKPLPEIKNIGTALVQSGGRYAAKLFWIPGG
jgi:hypothetical protein